MLMVSISSATWASAKGAVEREQLFWARKATAMRYESAEHANSVAQFVMALGRALHELKNV